MAAVPWADSLRRISALEYGPADYDPHDRICPGTDWLGERIVAADATRVQSDRLEKSHPRFHASRQGSLAVPLAFLGLPTRHQAALFLADGRVLIHEFR